MNLILQAIKALFRKVENGINGIQQTASTLAGKISEVEVKADNAQTTADAATTVADKAQSTANTAKSNAATAQTTANAAKTAAANAQTAADKKVGTRRYSGYVAAYGLPDIQVGECYSATQGKYASSEVYKAGDVVIIELHWDESGKDYIKEMPLLAADTSCAYGVTKIGDSKVFFVEMIYRDAYNFDVKFTRIF